MNDVVLAGDRCNDADAGVGHHGRHQVMIRQRA
jgi:hypothetical protein